MTTLQVPEDVQTRGLTSRLHRMVVPVGAAAAAGAVGLLVHAVDPNEAGHYPTCPFLMITGWWCPGCGSLRALHALSDGDVGTALARNPLTVVMLGVLLFLWAGSLRRGWTGRARTTLAPAWVLWGFLGVVLSYWVLRNLPGMTWLSPA
jgi:hypothetical protein